MPRNSMTTVAMTTVARTLLCVFAASAAQAQSAQSGLPDGTGKQLVQDTCSACHRLDQIARSSGYTLAGWKELTASMIDLSGNAQRWDEITGYLARHFPPNTRRRPVLIPGDVSVTFKEWVVPTLGQRSRDPIQAADGTIWWAGQWGNLIGRIDPRTGAMKEYPLPAGSMPHSVTVDRTGKVWYTGNKNATIGKLDPNTGKTTTFRMPDPAAKDPHTAIFDAQDTLWFTLQHSNMVGRLDPASGEIKLVTMQTRGSRPYGIKIDSRGVPWVACNGSNCLVKVDPKTLELTEIELPVAATKVRRLAIAGDGTIWYVNSSQGRLGRYDPVSGKIREWPSPSGPKSHPYAIAIVDEVVWYNESGTRPDTLVRFDPATEKFQSWSIPSGGIHAGIVRHMRPTREGNLLIHQSSTNRIIEVTLNPPVD
ncbi:MAG: Vgb family protein [Gammaproteobacteria bacterium]